MGDTKTIGVPEWWGKHLNPEHQFVFLLNPSLREESEGRKRVDSEILELIAKTGLSVTHNVESDFRVIGKKIDQEQEERILSEAVPDLKIPRTFSLEEFERKPFFPVLLVMKGFAQGQGKYLIENSHQWRKFINFIQKGISPAKFRSVVKEFINCPSERFTSYRVITSATGKILASALLYSGRKKTENEIVKSSLDPDLLGVPGECSWLDYLEVEKSPYYLGAKNVTSNISQGGDCIPLNPEASSKRISDEEIAILSQHGIDHEQKLPTEIEKLAKAIGKSLGRKLGLITGIDFIQDDKGNIYYLETNAEPGMKVYLAVKDNAEGTEIDGYRMAMKEAVVDISNV